MSLLRDYRASLKSLDVEEPIDIFVHRPFGFLLAKVLFHMPVSPNAVTVGSIIMGIAAGVCILWPFPYHLPVAGLLIFLSAVFDCADGQLARMRKTSSSFGRMLDGVADSIVMAAIVPPITYLLWKQYDDSPWFSATLVALWIVGVIVSPVHTALYDHYKNLYLFMTQPSYTDAEDVATATERRAKSTGQSVVQRFAWVIYMLYVRSQNDAVGSFDPFTVRDYHRLPPFDSASAAVYRQHNQRLMRVWKSMFGVGSLVFGLAVFTALGRPDIYLVFRLFFMNAVFYLYLRPAQRRASQATWKQLGVVVPPISGA